MDRYSRQVLFSGIGEKGQEKILAAKAVLIGCGALGTVQAESLVRAGLGTLRIIDRDFIEASNLQRQTLFDEEDMKNGLPKAVAAEKKLRKINSEVVIEGVVEDVNHTNIEEFVSDAQLILDGTDNFETRFLINDVSIKHKIPWIYGACVGSYGLSMAVVPERTPCLRCLFLNGPPLGSAPTCDTAGVIAPIVHIIAAWQVADALKILSGNLDRLSKKLINVDVWESRVHMIDVSGARTSDCPACGKHKYEYLRGKEGSAGVVLCGRNSVQINRLAGKSIQLPALAERLKNVGEVVYNEFLLQFQADGFEIAVFADGRGIVKGTKDIGVAKSVFAKYIGT